MASPLEGSMGPKDTGLLSFPAGLELPLPGATTGAQPDIMLDPDSVAAANVLSSSKSTFSIHIPFIPEASP